MPLLSAAVHSQHQMSRLGHLPPLLAALVTRQGSEGWVQRKQEFPCQIRGLAAAGVGCVGLGEVRRHNGSKAALHL
jgi:hypothetical protein